MNNNTNPHEGVDKIAESRKLLEDLLTDYLSLFNMEENNYEWNINILSEKYRVSSWQAQQPVGLDRKKVMEVLISHFRHRELNLTLQDIADELMEATVPKKEEGWLTEKPVFDRDCILLTGTKIREKCEYSSWLIKWLDFDEGGYWGWLNMDGEEYGDINDLHADLYNIIELPTSEEETKEQ